jgi:hypothetical protein
LSGPSTRSPPSSFTNYKVHKHIQNISIRDPELRIILLLVQEAFLLPEAIAWDTRPPLHSLHVTMVCPHPSRATLNGTWEYTQFGIFLGLRFYAQGGGVEYHLHFLGISDSKNIGSALDHENNSFRR